MRLVRNAVVMRTAIAGVVLAIGLAGCSASTASSDGGSTALDAAAAANTIRDLGTVTVRGSASLDRLRTAIGGRIQYRPSYRALLQLPASGEHYLTGVQYRRVGNRAWVRRSVVTTPGVVTYGTPLLTFRSNEQAPFVVLDAPDVGVAQRVGIAYDPARLLDALGHIPSLRWRRAPSRSGGALTFRTELPVPEQARLGIRIVEVGTDAHRRPNRVRITTPTGLTSEYSIGKSAGRTVEVAAPSPAQVEAASRPTPDAVDPYAEVFAGAAGATQVSVRRASARDGWSCFRVESSPPYGTAQTLRPSGGVCVPPSLAGDAAEDAIEIPIDADASTPYELLGATVPPGSRVSMELLDGHTVPMTVDPSGLAIYAGPTISPAALMTIVTPNGATVVCGPGPLNAPGDIATAPAPEVIRSDPWNCLAQDLATLLAG